MPPPAPGRHNQLGKRAARFVARYTRKRPGWVRITGTDLDAIPHYHFRAKTDQIVEKV